MKRLIFAVALSVVTFHCSAYDGNDLYTWAKEYKNDSDGRYVQQGFYMGYVTASASYTEIQGRICPPQHTKNEQYFDIVYAYLKDHPATRTDDALIIIEKSLMEVWPCRKP
ncbi:Rap1a/Tai family immunity protein [Enterobacter roggenkampii]|uniref:Rap1a/Tai family immunity protein n=1 Tax=Enterobacter roggenkampii TaxID=1812935 RepID=UPI001238A388|nr:Rap1a/Tai family immunity protein [Enterobacter roggenkampii]MCK6768797.1 hypothetical protein [Enterobacter roggenkampii]